jgi:hypothetical protein
MCQVTVKYSENLPSTEPNSYKTRHFAVELTEKVDDNDKAVEVTAQLFRVAKAQVKSQIQSETADLAMSAPKSYTPYEPPKPLQQVPFQQQPPRNPTPQQFSPQDNRNDFRPASPKQINFILMLAKKQGLKDYEIKNLPQNYFNATGFDQISSQQASELIESLNGKKQAA